MTHLPQTDQRALLASCVAAAAKSAEIIRAGAARLPDLQWDVKSDSDFVSDVDRKSEETLGNILRDRHPDSRLIAEEFSPGMTSLDGLVFVADPLDGTTNFLHGFPWYAVSIGAVVNGEIEAGVVLNAATGELFTATRGGGARRAGQPISVSKITDPARALIGTGFPFKPGSPYMDPYLQMLPKVIGSTAGLRRAGAAALDLADVACGRFEAFWEMLLAPWDITAGLLLIREAGGVVTDFEGEPCPIGHTAVVAGNPSMHEWLIRALRSA